ncbi:MAG: methylated-DNA--[protein]-cysteine S-methyltransferase [Chloroflexota bacterium]
MTTLIYTQPFATPFGTMAAAVDEAGVLRYLSLNGEIDPITTESVVADSKRCDEAVKQLNEYFRQERYTFDLPLAPHGTAFQQTVWTALQTIPYGTTISYRELAERIGNPAAVRAVGRANATNPIAIIIPCHRVIGADGTLVGYGGGLELKEQLLKLEGATVHVQQRLML